MTEKVEQTLDRLHREQETADQAVAPKSSGQSKGDSGAKKSQHPFPSSSAGPQTHCKKQVAGEGQAGKRALCVRGREEESGGREDVQDGRHVGQSFVAKEDESEPVESQHGG